MRAHVAWAALVAVLLASCGGRPPSTIQEVGPSAPAEPIPVPSLLAAKPDADPVSLLQPGITYAALSHDRFLDVWEAPTRASQVRFRFDTNNDLGVRVPFLVAGDRDRPGPADWLKVYLPIRPNEGTGWVRASDVRLVQQRERIVVDLSERVLEHFVDGRLVDRFPVGVGLPQYPTATGTFYVVVRVRYAEPSGPYGAMALGLSGFSDVLTEWPGGGRMAIHGTADPGDRGQRVSHGCVRVYNPDLRSLRKVPLGTPVAIRR